MKYTVPSIMTVKYTVPPIVTVRSTLCRLWWLFAKYTVPSMVAMCEVHCTAHGDWVTHRVCLSLPVQVGLWVSLP